jgi:hypothetical protein
VSDGCIVRDNVCRENDVSALSLTDGLAVGIETDTNCTVVGNTCVDNDGKGAGMSVGILVDDNSRVEANHCTMHSGPVFMSYGIMAEGDQVMILSNTAGDNTAADITFWTGTNRGYAGGNISDTAIFDQGGNNELGTTPAPNATF